jgi:transposase-like protein
MRGRTVRTSKKRAAFLTSLAEGASVTAAARIAGIGRASLYDWRWSDANFADAWDSAN